MLDQAALGRTLFPVGRFAHKAELRALAAELGLRTATKPDSQDVCFITSTGGRHEFLRRRLPLHPAHVVDTAGRAVGEVPAIELVTIGQRTGLGLPGGGPKRFVVDVDRATATVVVGDERDLLGRRRRRSSRVTWVDAPVDGDVLVQCSAHGDARPATLMPTDGGVDVHWSPAAAPRRARPERRVLRPAPTASCSAAASPADGRVSDRRGGGRRTAPGGRRRSAVRWIARPRGVAGRGGEHRRRRLGEGDLARRCPGVGPVRSRAPCRAAGATRPTEAIEPARQHQRLGEHDRVVDDEPGRHDDEPAPAELVPARAGAATSPRRRRPRRPRRGPTRRAGPARAAPRRPRRPTPPTTRPSPRGSRAAGAAGSAARRRRPTPARSAGRCRPTRRARRRRRRARRGRGRAPPVAPADRGDAGDDDGAGHDRRAPRSASRRRDGEGERRRHAHPPTPPTVPASCTAPLRSASASPTARAADDGDGEPRRARAPQR